MNQILREPNIWDLHIHTPLGTPTQKNYDGISSVEFVDSIIKLFDDATHKVGMISFTDHNKINSEVYKLFQSKSDIVVIPGVEMDVYLTPEDKNSKHIIFYFEEKELEDIDALKILIESYVNDHDKVNFEHFISYLTHNKKRFVVSPHAFKQDKRDINYEWCNEELADKGTTSFSGLFFPFWEAGGKSAIWKAIEFLEDQCGSDKNRQAVIAFSDSSDFKKLKAYIDDPHQYFLCLNSFKGLLLAGSDLSRIIYKKEVRPHINPSEKIKSIVVSNDLKPLNDDNKIEIELSDRLNVIVGGRGKGKSALMGAIVSAIDASKVDSSRASFVKKFHAQIKNFNETSMTSDTKIEYLSQSYINQLFDNDKQNKLEEFFRKQFADNDNISKGISNILTVIENSEKYEVFDDINVIDDLKNIVRIASKTSDIYIARKKVSLIPLEKDCVGYKKAVKKILPSDREVWDEELENLLDEFICALLENIVKVNYSRIKSIKFAQLMRKRIELQKKKRSNEDKRKIEAKMRIEQKLRYLYTQELERVRQINRLYEIEARMTELQMQYQMYNGENENQIYFVSVSNKEHPVEYARRLICDSINKSKIRNIDKESCEEVFRRYAISMDFKNKMREAVELSDLYEKISNLEDLKAKIIHRIIYKNTDGYVDLHKTSPGTQTSAIMEFVLHSDSTTTLLIDQPEDNIDNEARYAQLTKWVRKQKYNRQIILVTHDANIVINGDAECVIIANHLGDKFDYEFGALEYKDILDKAAVILDGGKTAIHRRMEKYGE